jgi:acetyltransferase-like isoleucine patch superfamily enzyme
MIEGDNILISRLLKIPKNIYHPLVYIGGNPTIGKGTYIGMFSEINAKGGFISIGQNCDIASFCSINVADSHKKCIGLSDRIERGRITLEDNVFIGSHSFIGGNVEIGHHSVIAAGTILIADGLIIPPYSLVVGNPFAVKAGYYKDERRIVTVEEIAKMCNVPVSVLQKYEGQAEEFIKYFNGCEENNE